MAKKGFEFFTIILIIKKLQSEYKIVNQTNSNQLAKISPKNQTAKILKRNQILASCQSFSLILLESHQ